MDGHNRAEDKEWNAGDTRRRPARSRSHQGMHGASGQAQPTYGHFDDETYVPSAFSEPPRAVFDQYGRPTFQSQPSAASTATVKTSSAGSFVPYTAPETPRSEHSHYPNQAYAALHDQTYPSQPSQMYRSKHHSSYSVTPASTFYPDHHSAEAGSKTAGNSPSTTPGLFTPTTTSPASPAFTSADVGEDGSYSSPYLHFMQRQAPKETHVADVDVDPISGRKLINQYEIIDELGRGVHGKVKLGRNLTTGKYVAIKIVDRFARKRRLGKAGNPAEKIKKEIAILKKARHPNIVGLLEVIDDPAKKKVYIVLEHVEMGEVKWRTEGTEEIVLIEHRRFERERLGMVDDTAAYIEDDKILQDASKKRQRMERRYLRDVHRLAARGDTEPWSFEHGGGVENDASDVDRESHNSATPSVVSLSDAQLSETIKPSDHGRLDNVESTSETYPHTTSEAFSVHDGDNGRSLLSLTENEAKAGLVTGLEGTMYGAYEPEAFHAQTPSIVSSSLSQEYLVNLDDVPEHFHHVPLMTLSAARSAFRDTVLGLEYLHYQGVIHRDIKPANLLQTKDHRVKISDFGVSYLGRQSKQVNPEDPSESDVQDLDEALELAKTVGTPAFYAPELCQTDCDSDLPVTGQIDVWALGVTLYCLVYGRVPYHDLNTFVLMRKIAEDDVYIPRVRLKAVDTSSDSRPSSRGRVFASTGTNKRAPHELAYEAVDEDLHDLIKRLLIKDPRHRITLKEVKRHPWVLRDIANPVAWVEETDPSRLTEGKKIEVSNEDVADAVVPLNIIERVRSGIRKLGGALRLGKSSGSRARAQSAANSSDAFQLSATSSSSTVSQEARRPSLRGDESIFSTLKTSREGEHPLSRSQTASPEVKEDVEIPQSPVSRPASPRSIASKEELSVPPPLFSRPVMPERAQSSMSTAGSIRTIRQSDIYRKEPTLSPHHSSQGLPNNPLPLEPLGVTTLGGFFGGAGRKLLKSVRSRDRSLQARPKESRTSSTDGIAAKDDDPHSEPSIGFSNAFAAGQVHSPSVLKDMPSYTGSVVSPATSTVPSETGADYHPPSNAGSEVSRSTSAASVDLSIRPFAETRPDEKGRIQPQAGQQWHTDDSADERFHRAQDELIRKRILEQNQNQDKRSSMAARMQSPGMVIHSDCPPSPDDDVFTIQRAARPPSHPIAQAAISPEKSPNDNVTILHPHQMISSSSEDHFASEMSQSTSHPSIPSVVSANSSVVPDEDFRNTPDNDPKYSSHKTIGPTPKLTEDDEGYAGDHTAETESDGEDSGDSFIEIARQKPSAQGTSQGTGRPNTLRRSRRRILKPIDETSGEAERRASLGTLQPLRRPSESFKNASRRNSFTSG